MDAILQEEIEILIDNKFKEIKEYISTKISHLVTQDDIKKAIDELRDEIKQKADFKPLEELKERMEVVDERT